MMAKGEGVRKDGMTCLYNKVQDSHYEEEGEVGIVGQDKSWTVDSFRTSLASSLKSSQTKATGQFLVL